MNLLMPPIAPVPFSGLMTIAWIAVFLLVGMVCRAFFPPFKKYLVPSCIIGGTIGLIFQSTGLLAKTGFGMDMGLSQIIVYHLFNITWILIGLKKPEKATSFGSKTKRTFWYLGTFQTITYCVFGAAALTTAVLSLIGLNSGPETLGGLTAYGFLGGPGAALTIANIWSAATSFTGLADYALASSALGFAVSIVIGITLLNVVAHKKKIDLVACPSEDEQCGYYECGGDLEDAGKQTTSGTSIDVLAWHLALTLGIYCVTYIIIVLLILFVLPQSLVMVVWAMFYLIASLIAIISRTVMAKLHYDHLLCNGVSTRLMNTVVDFMICATFMSISIGAIGQYLAPFLITAITTTIVVGVLVWFATSKLKEDGPQLFACVFGGMTGTVATSLILLRLVDPEGKSPAPLYGAVTTALNPFALFMPPLILNAGVINGFSGLTVAGFWFLLAVPYFIISRFFPQPKTETAWEPDAESN